MPATPKARVRRARQQEPDAPAEPQLDLGQINQLIQIRNKPGWALCFAIIDEIKPDGIMVYVRVPRFDGKPANKALIFLKRDEFELLNIFIIPETQLAF